MSWRDGNTGQTVDLDCSVVAYDGNGVRSEDSTVWFGRLRNQRRVDAKGKDVEGNSIVHT